MRPEFDILAVLGGGVDLVLGGKGGALRWRPTAYIEKCEPSTGKHLGTRTIRPDIDDPDCLIGSGNARVIAAVQFFEKYGARVVLFAYGVRTGYLVDLNGPSEGEVMKMEFLRRLRNDGYQLPLDVEVLGGIDSDDPRYLPSNTLTELNNILELAAARRMSKIAIITAEFHMPRVQVFANGLKAKNAVYGNLELTYRTAEELLLSRSQKYLRIITAVRRSSATVRTIARKVGREVRGEAAGIQAFVEGKCQAVLDPRKGGKL